MVRLVLNFIGVEYEEETLEGYDQWFPTKFERGLAFPNLPFLVDGEFRLTETTAIIEYICAKYKPELLGSTPEQSGHVFMLRNILMDSNRKLRALCYDQDSKEIVISQAIESFSPVHEFMESKKWITGDSLTYVDLILFEIIEFLDALSDGQILDTFPRFRTHWENVKSIPEIKAYKTGPKFKQDYAFNGYFAQVNCKQRETEY